MDLSGHQAIDTVVNIWTQEALSFRPDWRPTFYGPKMKVPEENSDAVPLDRMIEKMKAAGISRGFLVTTKCGSLREATSDDVKALRAG